MGLDRRMEGWRSTFPCLIEQLSLLAIIEQHCSIVNPYNKALAKECEGDKINSILARKHLGQQTAIAPTFEHPLILASHKIHDSPNPLIVRYMQSQPHLSLACLDLLLLSSTSKDMDLHMVLWVIQDVHSCSTNISNFHRPLLRNN